MHQPGQRPSGDEASFDPFVRNTASCSGEIELAISEKYCLKSKSLMGASGHLAMGSLLLHLISLPFPDLIF